MKKYKVAICIPYYKKRDLLERLLNSICMQKYNDYVAIVTDDGADDEAQKLIKKHDEHFVYFRNDRRYGPSGNCNQSIRIAQKYEPDYIKIMHNDDFFTFEDSLAKYVSMLDSNSQAMIAFSGSYILNDIDAEGYARHATKTQICDLHSNIYSLIGNNCIGAPSATIVRNSGILMDESLIMSVDIEWYIKHLEFSNVFEYTEEPLITNGVDGNRVTDQVKDNLKLLQEENLYMYVKHSQMQSDSYLDRIIHTCMSSYWGEKKYWFEKDYLAILHDAVNDKKAICLWGKDEVEIQKAYEYLKKRGITVSYWLNDERTGIVCDTLECISACNLAQRKRMGVLCLIMLDKVKPVRLKLKEMGIDAMPYLEKYIQKYHMNFGMDMTYLDEWSI